MATRRSGPVRGQRVYSVEIVPVGTVAEQEAVRQGALQWLAVHVLPRLLARDRP